MKEAFVLGFAALLALAPLAGADGGLPEVRVGQVVSELDSALDALGLLPHLGAERPTPPSPRSGAPAYYGETAFVAPPSQVPLLATLGIAALAALALKALAPLYARLDRNRIVSHPVRRRLLALVAEQPGLHLEAAQAAAGIGAGSAAHHVRVLLDAGLLREQRAGRFRRLYPGDASPVLAAKDATLRQPRAAALYQLVQARPGVGLREAGRALGVPASSLQWHAERLTRAGLIQRRPEGLFPAA